MKEEELTQITEQMQVIKVFGQNIHYYDVGSGPVLVLLHGVANNAYLTWGKVMGSLAATHRVLAMDQIGFGASDRPAIEFRIQTYVDFLGEFLRLKGIKHFTLAGVSMGGWIAASYAIQALQSPKHILPIPSKLLLCNAGGLAQQFSADLSSKLLPGSIEILKEALDDVFFNVSFMDDETIRNAFISRLAANDGVTVRSLLKSIRETGEWVDDKLHLITVPTLIVWGVDDRLIPFAKGQYFAKYIPKAEIIAIEECGHAPMIEKPIDFLTAIKGFLDVANRT